MSKTGFTRGNFLIPKVSDMSAWSVIACDQFTSQPNYWQDVEDIVKNNPSTLNMIIPDVNLGSDDLDQRICALGRAMRTYLRRHILEEVSGYIYVERTLSTGKIRSGLVGLIDLEEYDYKEGRKTKVRATEKMILSRLPIRVEIRQSTPLEVSHIMMVMDDRHNDVLGPLRKETEKMTPLYHFELMKGSGQLKGYLVTPQQADSIDQRLNKLADLEEFKNKYNVEDAQDQDVLVFAVGDGNHSLAAAKDYYENIKKSLSKEKAENHPARYALVELINLNDDSLEFEPINRIVFGVDTINFMKELEKAYQVSYEPCEGCQFFDVYIGGECQRVWIKNPSSNVVTGTVQNFIDTYIQEFSGKVDYVHGSSIVQQLAVLRDNVGIIFPAIGKEKLFETILIDGILPRKTFSMGSAEDKRFYLECRKLVK